MSREIYRPIKAKGFYKKSIFDLSLEAVKDADYQVLNYIFCLSPKIKDIYWDIDKIKDKNFIPGNLHLIALLFDRIDLSKWLQKKYLDINYQCKNYDTIIKFWHRYNVEYSYNVSSETMLVRSLSLFCEFKDQILYFDKLQYKYESNDCESDRTYSFSNYEYTINENGIEQMSGFVTYQLLLSSNVLSKDLMKLVKSYITDETILDDSNCSYHKEIMDITKFSILR